MVHEGVRRERLESLARWVGDVLSYQLAPAICRLNYGADDECPMIAPDFMVPEEPLAKVQRLQLVSQLVPVPRVWLAEQLGVPVEEPEETTKGTNEDGVPVQARDGGELAQRTLADLASALSEDLRPVRRRLEKALAQENEENAKQELRELLADLPQLFRRVNADPDTARAIEEAIVEALAEGVTAKACRDGEGLQAYDPNEPRDEQGRFADDGEDAPEDARIAAMYDAAIGSNNKEYLNFGVIDTRAAKRLSKAGGPDLQGYTHRIESDAIRHIINEHGDPGKAARRGELPVTRNEIARIPHYLRSADSVKEEGGTLIWQKRINGKVIIIEEIRDSHRRLAVKTMKIRREKA